MKDINKTIENIEKGNAWEKTDEVVQIEVKKPLDKVIPVRLSSEKWEKLRHEAEELGIGPTTLVRMWILERLRQKKTIESQYEIQRTLKHSGVAENKLQNVVRDGRQPFGKIPLTGKLERRSSEKIRHVEKP
jgi:hypothetical protein